MKKIILAGGSGFLGSVLAKYFHSKLYDVVILSRNPKLYDPVARHIHWDGKNSGEWIEEFENAFAVINLTGRTVNCRYTEKNKQEILESRVNATIAVGLAIQQCKNPPKVWIIAASATYYRSSFDRDMDEHTGETAEDFSMGVCKAWEKSFWEMKTPSTRKIVTRTSLGLGNYANSVLPVMKRLVRFGLGGKMGSGKQYFSWIHEEDYARAIDFLLERNDLSGTFNITAPNPLPNKDFMKLLRSEMKMPIGIGATKWMLEVGAIFIGTETELVLKSRRVVPKKLLEAGFQFEFPDVKSALHDLIQKTNHGRY
jgi:uncharacterized protein (TIGR01777 family)